MWRRGLVPAAWIASHLGHCARHDLLPMRPARRRGQVTRATSRWRIPMRAPPIALAELLVECPGATLVSGSAQTMCTGVTQDSRAVQPGWIFVAIRGLERDGRGFIPQAIRAGAVAVVTDTDVDAPSVVALLRVPSARAALADLSSALWRHPSGRLTLIGITGTDGKTSTAQLIGTILRASGRTVGWLTTAGIRLGDEQRPNTLDHTTPEAPAVQALLAEMVARGVDTAVLEVSSHALALDRVRGCQFDAAVFTNLSPEHLNFHGSLDAYRDAKAQLFRMLQPKERTSREPFGVVNLDDPAATAMIAAAPGPVVTYALDCDADLTAHDLALTAGGSRFVVRTPTTEFPVQTRLIGRFNVSNWLAAIATSLRLGASLGDVQRAAEELGPVRGRMEPVEAGQPFLVVVDFAHTPQALETALRALRPHTRGRLLTLFGQAGGRDPANRPAMGIIASKLADFFLITTDDPINEDPAAIASVIAEGARSTGAIQGDHFDIELDRRSAVKRLIRMAGPDDVVLLAGKGHEQRMLIGDRKLRWDDAEAARTSIRQRFRHR